VKCLPEDKIQWHPVFATAFKLELQDYYPQVLDIQEEYQLTSKPLEVDILVIKKLKDVSILKNIAKIFRGHNIVEYKSPDDYLSIDDYYKVKAYTYLYKTLGEHVDEIKVDNLTVTMVSSGFPDKMVAHICSAQKVEVKKQEDGIYSIEGEDIQSQIIVVDELPKRENRYIRLLTKRLNIRDEISLFLKEYARNPKDSRYELLMNAVSESNIIQVMEVYRMARVLTLEEEKAIEEVIQKFNFNKKWHDEGKIEGEITLLIRLLNKRFGMLPDALYQEIVTIQDPGLIEAIIDNIFEIDSMNELEEYIKSYN